MAIPPLDQLADIYGPASDGQYTDLIAGGVPCRLCVLGPGGGPGGSERTEAVGKRLLMWDRDYVMPDDAQALIDGERWNVVTPYDLVYTGLGPAREPSYRRAVAMQADT